MLKTLLAIGGLQLATMAVLLVRTKVLALYFGPELVGLMAVVDKLIALAAQAVSLSLPFAALRFLPELWNRDRLQCYRTLRAMSITLAALAALATLAGSALSLTWPSVFGAQLAAHPVLLAAAFLSLPALVFAAFIVNAFAGIMRHRSSMLFGLAHAAVQTASGLIAVLAGTLSALYLAYAGMAAALLGPALARVMRAARPTPAPALGGWRGALPSAPILRFSAAMFALTVLAPFAALFAHYLVLREQGASEAGYMQAAIGISLAVRAVLGAAHPVYLTPQLNKGGSWEERMQWAARFQTLWCLIAGILVPPLLLLADWAIVVLYADSFLPATRFVHLFVFAEVLTAISGTYQGLIVAADRVRFHVAQNIAAQALFAAIAWFAIPRIGITGAAAGAIAVPVFLFACTSLYLRHSMGLRAPRRTTGLTLYVLLVVALAGQYGAGGTTLSAAGIGRMLAAYALVVAGLFAFLSAAQRDELVGWLERRFPGRR